jgi:hypothetical protein
MDVLCALMTVPALTVNQSFRLRTAIPPPSSGLLLYDVRLHDQKAALPVENDLVLTTSSRKGRETVAMYLLRVIVNSCLSSAPGIIVLPAILSELLQQIGCEKVRSSRSPP